MRKFFNGEYGLGTTYWVGIFGAGVVIKIVMRAINKGYLTIQDDEKFNQLEMLHNILLVALCIYLMLMVRAMIKAGFDNRRPGAWGWIGIAGAIISMLYMVLVTVTVFFPSTTTPKFMLELEVQQMNKQLPQDMGDGLVMMRAEIKNDDLIYYAQVDGVLDDNMRASMQSALIDSIEGQEVCQDFQGYFKGGINAIVYEYAFDNDTVRQEVNAAECMLWLAEH